jgi:DNA polymerase III delta subunit
MHIEKEQGQFFHQCMQYLSKQELENMLQEFSDFDRKMMHTKHQQIVEKMENDR